MKLLTVVLVLAALAAAIIIGLPRYLGPDDLRSCPDQPTQQPACRPADAVIAISGGDTLARADEAIKLYQHGWAPLLIFSGAAQDKSGPSNAEVMRARAVEQGVPSADILVENFAKNTAENAKNTLKISNDYDLNRIVLVTSAYHQRRASLEFKSFFGSSVQIVNHPVPHDKQWARFWWLTPVGWWLALSELAKIIVLSFISYGR
ncbi:MAG TPA: YdcF family protein [Candidatus Saccharimonadales bacterium]|nr:YdcF family protein [Candidatus Saccharimonadales bacterium]